MKFEKNFSVAIFKERTLIWGVLEAAAITIVILLVMLALRPDDPFTVSGPIPWIVLAPILCSLLYGTLNGVISLLLLLAYFVLSQQGIATDSFVFREYLVGVTTLTLLVGIFSSYWIARIRHVEYLNKYVREHLDDLSREYYLLRISHERLEHSYITKPVSFRDAFYQIKNELLKNNGELTPEVCLHLLNIFSQYCSITQAIFSLYDSATHELKPLAKLGKDFSLSLDDALIKSSLQNKITTYSAVNALSPNEHSEYLAVIPFINSLHKVIGFVIIKEMPFLSLTHDNLEVLSVFAASFALQLSVMTEVKELIQQYPNASPEFLRELHTLVILKKRHKVDSVLAGLVVPEGFFQKNIVYSLEQQKRSLDYTWVTTLRKASLIITLMPLTGMDGVLGYKRRLNEWLKSEFGQDLNKKGMDFRYQQLSEEPISKQLDDLIKELSYADN